MRLSWLAIAPVMLAAGGTAHADQKLSSYKPEFVREAAGCQVQVNGLARVVSGATDLAKTAEAAERAELERDLEQVTAGLALEKEYCDEVAGMIAFIDANAATPYKKTEVELDGRYKKILKLRASTKKMLEDLQPTTRKLIPKLGRRPPPAPTEPKLVPGKFPSGRIADLPALGGTWRLSGSSTTDTADYREAPAKAPPITASATTRSFTGGTCDVQRKALLLRGDAEQLADLPLPGAKEAGVAWALRFTRREESATHLVSVLCVPGATGGVLATADVVPADQTALSDHLAKLLLRMLAARKP
jgi:hypothetical protein